MANGEEAGSAQRFLARADGGLLALNLGALTFVAGAEKFQPLPTIVNLKILVGGLCAGLFFAILCAYITMFGARATVAAAKRLRVRAKFDPDLTMVMETDDARRGLSKFSYALLACVMPLVLVLQLVSGSSIDVRDRYRILSQHEESYRAACGAKQTPAAMPLAVRSAMRDPCEARLEVINAEREDASDIESSSAAYYNALIIGIILFYLVLPFYAWTDARGRFKRPARAAGSAAKDGAERVDDAKMLSAQMAAIQSLRLAAAVTSLAAFMIGVGLALVNVSVANVGAGLTEDAVVVSVATAPAATSSPQLNTAGRPVGPRGEDQADEKNEDKCPKPSEPAAVKLEGMDVLLDALDKFAAKLEQPPATQTLRLEGLPTPPPAPPATTVRFPSSLTLQGLPAASAPVVNVQPAVVKGEPGQNGQPGAVGPAWRCRWTPFRECGYEAVPPEKIKAPPACRPGLFRKCDAKTAPVPSIAEKTAALAVSR